MTRFSVFEIGVVSSFLVCIGNSVPCDSEGDLYKCWDNNGAFELSYEDNCTLSEWLCDDIADCPFGDDEWNCPSGYESCVNKTDSFGNPMGFACDDTTCIYYQWSCLSNDFTTWDCPNQEDVSETICSQNPSYIDCVNDTSKFKCDNTNGRCIDLSKVCDGFSDCLDGQDESNALCGNQINTTNTYDFDTTNWQTEDSTHATNEINETDLSGLTTTDLEQVSENITNITNVLSTFGTLSTTNIDDTETNGLPTNHPVTSSGTVRGDNGFNSTLTTMPAIAIETTQSETKNSDTQMTTQLQNGQETTNIIDTSDTTTFESINETDEKEDYVKSKKNHSETVTIVWVTFLVVLVLVVSVWLAMVYVNRRKKKDGRIKHSRIDGASHVYDMTGVNVADTDTQNLDNEMDDNDSDYGSERDQLAGQDDRVDTTVRDT